MAESKITAIIGKLAMPTSMPIKLQITGIIKYKLGKKDVPAGPGIIFDGNYSVQERNDTEALHHEVCNAYPQVIDVVDNNPDKYQQWFGSPNPDCIAKVKKVYEKCYRGLMENTVTYYFRGRGCDIRIYAHSHYGINKLVLCELYIKANEKSTALDKDSKQQTLVHEWSHIYADTDDVDLTYGTEDCIKMAKNDPDKATNNAENYGYFYCDIVEHLP